MRVWRSLWAGLRALGNRRRVDGEMDEELAGFIAASVEEKRKRGMTAKEARRAAKVEMGSTGVVKHRVWGSRWEASVDHVWKDVRFAARQLVKTPGFTLVALLSLSLGIGANTAIFTLLNAVMLRTLPVPEPQRLVLFGKGRGVGSTGSLPFRSWELFSYSMYKRFAASAPSFSGMTAVSSIQMGSRISLNGALSEPVHIDMVSGSYFDVLGVTPAMGRVLGQGDETAPGANPVAVASYGWFQRHYSGDPAALGQTIRMQGHDYTLIGVAKAGFAGLTPAQPADLWIPITMEKEISPGWNGLEEKFFQSLYLVGRLKPGVTMQEATASTNLLFQQMLHGEFLSAKPSPKDLQDVSHARVELVSAAGGLPRLKNQFSEPLGILMAIVGLVLLIACANIANMLMARGLARTRELAVRQALGASRRRIVTQLLTESLLLALSGAGLGLLLAWKGSHLLLAMVSQGPEPIPLDVSPDYRVLGFTLLVTVLTALLFGIAPAMNATKLELIPALKDGRGGSSASSRGVLARSLIVGQIALSILLLAAAGLFLHSLRNLASVDLGFNPHHVLVFTLDEFSANLPLDQRMIQMQHQIEESVQALPNVKTASLAMFAFNQGEWSDSVLMQGVQRTPENGQDVLYNVIGTQYLETFGIPLLAGRNFTAQDTKQSPQVAMVNETLVKRFFPDGRAVGRRFHMGNDPAAPNDIEIVGVVKDAKYVGLGEAQEMAAYFPWTQRVQYFGNFTVRYEGPSAPVMAAVRRTVSNVNPNVAVGQIVTLDDLVAGSIVTQRLVGMLSAFFAGLAVFLAAIGIYGLMNLTVTRRMNEIGIRLALGAQTGGLIWMILRESLLLLAGGLALGLPVALATARGLGAVLKHQLFEVNALDPMAFGAAIGVISAISMIAAWMPARRASRVDPMVALRCE